MKRSCTPHYLSVRSFCFASLARKLKSYSKVDFLFLFNLTAASYSCDLLLPRIDDGVQPPIFPLRVLFTFIPTFSTAFDSNYALNQQHGACASPIRTLSHFTRGFSFLFSLLLHPSLAFASEFCSISCFFLFFV